MKLSTYKHILKANKLCQASQGINQPYPNSDGMSPARHCSVFLQMENFLLLQCRSRSGPKNFSPWVDLWWNNDTQVRWSTRHDTNISVHSGILLFCHYVHHNNLRCLRFCLILILFVKFLMHKRNVEMFRSVQSVRRKPRILVVSMWKLRVIVSPRQ